MCREECLKVGEKPEESKNDEEVGNRNIRKKAMEKENLTSKRSRKVTVIQSVSTAECTFRSGNLSRDTSLVLCICLFEFGETIKDKLASLEVGSDETILISDDNALPCLRFKRH